MKNYLDVFSLKGKNVYIVGGLGLIGMAVSKAVAASGGKAVILDLDLKKSKEILSWAKKNKYRLFYEHFDGSDLEGCEAAMQGFVRKYGPLHVLINCSYPRSHDWAQSFEKM